MEKNVNEAFVSTNPIVIICSHYNKASAKMREINKKYKETNGESSDITSYHDNKALTYLQKERLQYEADLQSYLNMQVELLQILREMGIEDIGLDGVKDYSSIVSVQFNGETWRVFTE